MRKIESLTGFQMDQLVFNHRLPKKIARMAQYLNSGRDDLEERCRDEGTEKPKILEYNSFELELDAVFEIIKNRSFKDVGGFI